MAEVVEPSFRVELVARSFEPLEIGHSHKGGMPPREIFVCELLPDAVALELAGAV